jgi:D-alanyl-D-alanine carboxypeptidase (penicillin-binding protein 5/6)
MRSAILFVALVLAGAASATDPPVLSAKSAIVIDERSGKVLFQKAADARRFPASTTKILTSLLLLEKCYESDRIVAPSDVELIEGASLHLLPGESLSAKDMLYALLLRSANDACYAVAIHIAGSVPDFAKLMNERAAQIGCKHSHFVTPNGLHDPNHYTTARDLALIAREAMRNPAFRGVVATRMHFIDRDFNMEDRLLISKNRFLGTDPTADGIKTGYTRPAGQCFVGSATRSGYRFITVVLNSKHWEKDHKALINWAFKTFERSIVAERGLVVGTVQTDAGPSAGIPVRLSEPVYYAHRKGGAVPFLSKHFEVPTDLKMPISEGQPIGDIVYSDGKTWTYHAKIEAAMTVEESPLKSTANRLSFAMLASVLGAGAFIVKRKVKR